ncbi:MAG TPA: hypothetical protein ENF83_02070 [Candidatus Korarchaeota archaeon]|nr:hypothetical protein [Candidatus Korarchaeota archaeon]
MTRRSVTRASAWLAISRVLTSAFGYIYWAVVARLAGEAVVGAASAAVGIGTILQLVGTLGVHRGAQGLFAEALGRGDEETAGAIFGSTLTLALLTCPPLCLTTYAIARIQGFDGRISALVGAMAWFGSLTFYLRGLISASLNTTPVAMASLVSGATRLSLGTLLVYLGFEAAGAVGGYVAAWAVFSSVELLALRTYGFRPAFDPRLLKRLVLLGLPQWVAAVLMAAGNRIGVIYLHSRVGDVQAGAFFAALTSMLVLDSLSATAINLIYPAMKSGSDLSQAERVIRVASALSSIVASVAAVYGWLILLPMSRYYAENAYLLSIVALGFPLADLSLALSSVAYAMGDLWIVTLSGILLNGVRVLGFIALIPRMGALGAALAYLIGSLAGGAASSLLRLKYGMPLLRTAKALTLPWLVPAICWLVKVPWYAGIPLSLVASLALLLRLGALDSREMESVIRGIGLPEPLSGPIRWVLSALG